jgi:hypothetical protein
MQAKVARTVVMAVAVGLLITVQSSPSHAAVGFSFNWNGIPAAPMPWAPSTGFDVVVHDRDLTGTFERPTAFQAQHGSNCSPFQGFGVGGTHLVTTYQDEVFICNNHMMTGLNGQGYGEITFTPAALLDWSQGTASATWNLSTLRTSCRDWLSFNVMPFIDNLALTDGVGVDLAGEPRNELLFTTGPSCPSAYHGYDVRNFDKTDIGGAGRAVEDVVSPSAVTRSRFELDISRTHVRFGLPDSNLWMVDGDLKSPLPYGQAVVQFEQHSYTPDKECTPTPTSCAPNTWHWSNLDYSNIVPFSILRGDVFQVSHAPQNVVHFTAPAPANSFLRMEALAAPGSMKVSADGGQTWIPITRSQASTDNQAGDFTADHMNNIFLPIPQGTQTLTFTGTDTYWMWWVARNISIWSVSAAYSKVVLNPAPPAGTGPVTASQGSLPQATPALSSVPALGDGASRPEGVNPPTGVPASGRAHAGGGTGERLQPLLDTVAFVRAPAHTWLTILVGLAVCGAAAVTALFWMRGGPPWARRRRSKSRPDS